MVFFIVKLYNFFNFNIIIDIIIGIKYEIINIYIYMF